MIELIDVTKKFKNLTAVNNVSATFCEGEITGIVGRNGSGKTVLFKMICGLMIPTSGVISVDGRQIGKEIDFPDSLGLIIETPGFLPHATAYQNLMELAKIRCRIGKKEVLAALETVGLDAGSKKPVGNYSLGMRQRLGIAQAIMENPDILVLDEPMNGLDEDGVQEMRKLFLGFKEQGKTILIASHNREDIDLLCDHVYYMRKGVLQ